MPEYIKQKLAGLCKLIPETIAAYSLAVGDYSRGSLRPLNAPGECLKIVGQECDSLRKILPLIGVEGFDVA